MSSDQPSTIVIFGLTGDLAQRKLLPALAALLTNGRLHPDSRIVGVSRRAVTAADVTKHQPGLRPYVSMAQVDLDNPADYRALDDHLDQYGDRPRLFYLSVPPESYEPIISNLNPKGIPAIGRRLLIEKPFGYDLASAEALAESLQRHFQEDQVYRVDHYLAKPQLQAFLSANAGSLRPSDIQRVTISALESLTIEGRAAFYDKVGALRDLVQSHLLQVLAAIAGPASHPQRAAFLDSLQLDKAAPAVRGQYTGYKQAVGNDRSCTETYAAITLRSSLPAWQGTSFILRSGKALASKQTTIEIEYRDGQKRTVDLAAGQEGQDLPDAYENVFQAAAAGQHDQFLTSQEVLGAWRVVEPLIMQWQANADGLTIYQQGAASV